MFIIITIAVLGFFCYCLVANGGADAFRDPQVLDDEQMDSIVDDTV